MVSCYAHTFWAIPGWKSGALAGCFTDIVHEGQSLVALTFPIHQLRIQRARTYLSKFDKSGLANTGISFKYLIWSTLNSLFHASTILNLIAVHTNTVGSVALRIRRAASTGIIEQQKSTEADAFVLIGIPSSIISTIDTFSFKEVLSIQTNTLICSWNLERSSRANIYSYTFAISICFETIVADTALARWTGIGRTGTNSVYSMVGRSTNACFAGSIPNLISFASDALGATQERGRFAVAGSWSFIEDWIYRAADAYFVYKLEVIVAKTLFPVPKAIGGAFDASGRTNPEVSLHASTLGSPEHLALSTCRVHFLYTLQILEFFIGATPIALLIGNNSSLGKAVQNFNALGGTLSSNAVDGSCGSASSKAQTNEGMFVVDDSVHSWELVGHWRSHLGVESAEFKSRAIDPPDVREEDHLKGWTNVYFDFEGSHPCFSVNFETPDVEGWNHCSGGPDACQKSEWRHFFVLSVEISQSMFVFVVVLVDFVELEAGNCKEPDRHILPCSEDVGDSHADPTFIVVDVQDDLPIGGACYLESSQGEVETSISVQPVVVFADGWINVEIHAVILKPEGGTLKEVTWMG